MKPGMACSMNKRVHVYVLAIAGSNDHHLHLFRATRRFCTLYHHHFTHFEQRGGFAPSPPPPTFVSCPTRTTSPLVLSNERLLHTPPPLLGGSGICNHRHNLH